MTAEIHGCFKSHVSAACQAIGVPFSHFADQTQLDEFLIDTREVTCPREFAAKALVSLGSDARDQCIGVACVAVCTFLEEHFGRPVEDPEQDRRLKDLKDEIARGANERAYRGLIDSWHD
jgi:hypothetical protein